MYVLTYAHIFFFGSGSLLGEEQCRGEPIDEFVTFKEELVFVTFRSVRIEYGFECWSASKASKGSKSVVLKFGIPHFMQAQDYLLDSDNLYRFRQPRHKHYYMLT